MIGFFYDKIFCFGKNYGRISNLTIEIFPYINSSMNRLSIPVILLRIAGR